MAGVVFLCGSAGSITHLKIGRSRDLILMKLAQFCDKAAGLAALSTIRRLVENALAKVCNDPEPVSELVVAVNEAVTNVIVHGYRGQPGALDIAVEGDGERLSVRIRDHAPSFDPTTTPTPDLTLPLHRRPIGGMGVHMMRQYTDDLIYRPLSPTGNELVLVKWVTS